MQFGMGIEISSSTSIEQQGKGNERSTFGALLTDAASKFGGIIGIICYYINPHYILC